MNKTAIKKFAVWARKKLIEDTIYKASLMGITETGIAEELSQSTIDLKFYDIGTNEYARVSGKQIKQRQKFVEAIQEKEKDCKSYKEAFDFIVEEVAYTWFNRLIAIRFMEVNDYLPSRIRVLSSENKDKLEPDIVTNLSDTDLDFTESEKEIIYKLKDENKSDELFRMLFIKQCNKLNEILPELFEKTNDYTELLLNISFTDKEGIVYKLIHDIDEGDFNVEKEGQVEIIGWMYQYYITEKHDEIINIYKGTIKKEDIPAATQLFTTDWVVRYMVDNSLGRYWIERNPNSKLIEKLDFFVTPKNGEIKYIDEKITPIDITFMDNCMGSGHILVYAFDVLMEIYREMGYTDREAAVSIVENNLYGLDIDKRAYQLSYFAVMMKARQYNRRALTQIKLHHITEIEESNSINAVECTGNISNEKMKSIVEYLIHTYKDAKELGSLINVKEEDYKGLYEYLESNEVDKNIELPLNLLPWMEMKPIVQKLTRQAEIMSRKYNVVCTNPPYMSKLEGRLKKFIVDNYKDYSGDLFSVFIYRNFEYCTLNGYSAFMTPFVWMFIKTYEKLREHIINNKSIVSLIQMEYSAFEEATVPICSFVLKNEKAKEKALCFRLSDFKGGMEVQKEKVLEALANKDCGYFYEADQYNFSKIPGSPVAYWVSDKIYNIFAEQSIGDLFPVKKGSDTGDNDKFLRLWHETDFNKIGFNLKTGQDTIYHQKNWVPYDKGGNYRKWYGNNHYIIYWKNDGESLKNSTANLRSKQLFFKRHITWNAVTSADTSARLTDFNGLFDSSGSSMFPPSELESIYLALINSKVVSVLLKLINPTINFGAGTVAKIPSVSSIYAKEFDGIVTLVVDESKTDWDSFETSWDFTNHPLLKYGVSLYSGLGNGKVMPTIEIEINSDDGFKIYEKNRPKAYTIESAYDMWKQICDKRFDKLKTSEEELNRIFIEIYGLEDELTPEVSDKYVTVTKIFDDKEDIYDDISGNKYILTKQDVIKSLISYAVGCMLGRYSLDVDGLAYAGGDWDSSKYTSFIPDEDNCIPITDEDYFEDDIVGLFCKWIETVYGKEKLEENLKFIADALGNKGSTSREVIRNYFLKNFIKDHNKTYQKKPIYWLFDSGKQNGFKALCYMHRWNADTIGNMRVEYLHRMQRIYEREIANMQDIIDNSSDKKEIKKANERKEKLQKQLKETKDYDAMVAHLALSRIDIDLDDGVKVNYEKVQTGSDGEKYQILAKI